MKSMVASKRLGSLLMAIICLVLFMSQTVLAETVNTVPKYVFMFIGDGQGSPQIGAAQYYMGTLQNPDATLPLPAPLSFTGFPYTGIMTTYDASSFCPDSASTGTSMASGQKTLSGVVNYNIDLTESFPLITEYAKEAGKKIGVITSVSLDHATPAVYYAKAPSRSLYYDIAVQGMTGNVLDFLGGGQFLQPEGKDKDMENVYEIATQNGFVIADTPDAVRSLGNGGRVLAMVGDPDNAMGMQYEIDRVRKVAEGYDSLSLSEFVKAGINVLDNENGFYMMVEGGKVDWSSHANDGKTAIYETLAFSDAVQVAIDFANEHPDETLIIVTGDHETGGLSIGFAATAYETHFNLLQAQDISFNDFDKVVAQLRDDNADFVTALEVIEQHYGLTTKEDQPLTLDEMERMNLEDAFTLSMQPKSERLIGKVEELAYGGYEPLSMAVSHIMNNKAGLSYASYAHTGLQIPVYAMGIGAETFVGSYDNTDIFTKTMDIMGLSK